MDRGGNEGMGIGCQTLTTKGGELVGVGRGEKADHWGYDTTGELNTILLVFR